MARRKIDPADDPDTQDTPQPAAPTGDNTPVTEGTLARVLERMEGNAPIKKVPYAKFKTRSVFNPTGNKRRKLTRKCHQNGRLMNLRTLHDEEVALLNQLQPGIYFGGVIAVVLNDTKTELDMRYDNKSFDKRMAFKATGYRLRDRLRRMVEEGPTTP